LTSFSHSLVTLNYKWPDFTILPSLSFLLTLRDITIITLYRCGVPSSVHDSHARYHGPPFILGLERKLHELAGLVSYERHQERHILEFNSNLQAGNELELRPRRAKFPVGIAQCSSFQVQDPVRALLILILSSPAVACKAFADLPIADRSRCWSVERILGEIRVPPRVFNALTPYVPYTSWYVYIYIYIYL